MNPLLEQFLQEARENLKFIEQNLEELASGDDELLNSIFRAAHTLKGGSGIVGFEAVKNITHRAEDLLDLLRSKKIEYRASMLGVLYDAFDEVLNLIEAAEESGDVVEADEEVKDRIISSLCSELGIDEDGEKAWVLPFKLADSNSKFLSFKTLSIRGFEGKLPFEEVVITKENLNESRLYALFFDLDSDCMMFGNDPIYALSLLDDKVVSISSTFTREGAKDILTNFEDEEGLTLHLHLVAVVNATYEEIEEALYNFLDDIRFYPFSILSYINIASIDGLDFIKDLSKKVGEFLESKDTLSLKNLLSESINLINRDSKEALVLQRVIEIIEHTYDNDIYKLGSIFGINSDSIQTLDFDEVITQIAPVKENLPTTIVAVNESSDIDKSVAIELLKQQREQLKELSSDAVFQRVKYISKKLFKIVGIDFDESFDRDSLLEILTNFLSDDGVSLPKKIVKDVVVKEEVVNQVKDVVAQKSDNKKDIVGKVVKVNQESIDHLMSVVGELLVAKNSLPYLADSVFELEAEAIKRAILEKYSFIDRLTNQLQDLIMSMRMLPISYVFDRYPKLVRDISKKLDKKVKLIQEGGDTKLDKNMIEMLADPLIHIIRNSLDHGIELPDVRKESGKSDTGTILMRAYPQSDKVIIEIQDDGKGIDNQKVINKVLEKGLMGIEKIEQLNEDERLNLIFLPGLSTVEQISEYSGRGVGMDVVKKSIESFGGNVYLKSDIGKGTKLTMSIPVSLAVSTLLHVLMDNIHYGFPMDSVNETVKIDSKEITYLNNEPFVYIRGQVIPLIMIKEMLNINELKKEPLSIVVLNIKENTIAVVVNELLGQLDVVQKPLEGILATHPLISGTALLGNGQIIMIFDPVGILELSDEIKLDKI